MAAFMGSIDQCMLFSAGVALCCGSAYQFCKAMRKTVRQVSVQMRVNDLGSLKDDVRAATSDRKASMALA